MNKEIKNKLIVSLVMLLIVTISLFLAVLGKIGYLLILIISTFCLISLLFIELYLKIQHNIDMKYEKIISSQNSMKISLNKEIQAQKEIINDTYVNTTNNIIKEIRKQEDQKEKMTKSIERTTDSIERTTDSIERTTDSIEKMTELVEKITYHLENNTPKKSDLVRFEQQIKQDNEKLKQELKKERLVSEETGNKTLRKEAEIMQEMLYNFEEKNRRKIDDFIRSFKNTPRK